MNRMNHSNIIKKVRPVMIKHPWMGFTYEYSPFCIASIAGTYCKFHNEVYSEYFYRRDLPKTELSEEFSRLCRADGSYRSYTNFTGFSDLNVSVDNDILDSEYLVTEPTLRYDIPHFSTIDESLINIELINDMLCGIIPKDSLWTYTIRYVMELKTLEIYLYKASSPDDDTRTISYFCKNSDMYKDSPLFNGMMLYVNEDQLKKLGGLETILTYWIEDLKIEESEEA